MTAAPISLEDRAALIAGCVGVTGIARARIKEVALRHLREVASAPVHCDAGDDVTTAIVRRVVSTVRGDGEASGLVPLYDADRWRALFGIQLYRDELRIAIEEAFQIEISDAQWERVENIGQIGELVNRLMCVVPQGES